MEKPHATSTWTTMDKCMMDYNTLGSEDQRLIELLRIVPNDRFSC